MEERAGVRMSKPLRDEQIWLKLGEIRYKYMRALVISPNNCVIYKLDGKRKYMSR